MTILSSIVLLSITMIIVTIVTELLPRIMESSMESSYTPRQKSVWTARTVSMAYLRLTESLELRVSDLGFKVSDLGFWV